MIFPKSCAMQPNSLHQSLDASVFQASNVMQDVMMPDVDGIELLRHIRSDEAFNSMPVVSEPLSPPACGHAFGGAAGFGGGGDGSASHSSARRPELVLLAPMKCLIRKEGLQAREHTSEGEATGVNVPKGILLA